MADEPPTSFKVPSGSGEVWNSSSASIPAAIQPGMLSLRIGLPNGPTVSGGRSTMRSFSPNRVATRTWMLMRKSQLIKSTFRCSAPPCAVIARVVVAFHLLPVTAPCASRGHAIDQRIDRGAMERALERTPLISGMRQIGMSCHKTPCRFQNGHILIDHAAKSMPGLAARTHLAEKGKQAASRRQHHTARRAKPMRPGAHMPVQPPDALQQDSAGHRSVIMKSASISRLCSRVCVPHRTSPPSGRCLPTAVSTALSSRSRSSRAKRP